ncbi:MAG: hypothetical protein JWP76_1707 [Dactylosporangium sp.]|jgi:hypothetical protein|nr:hypothetical protein [Dactylosporangium sp.]
MWSSDAVEAALAQGVSPSEANVALRGEIGRRLLIPINDRVTRVIGQAPDGRLIEIWLDETVGGWHEPIYVFEAGFDGKARWANAQEEGQ